MDRDTFERLQQAAEKRVINQQKRESSYTKPIEPNTQSKPEQTPAPPMPPQQRSRSKELIGLLNLKNISLDSERALIMGILLLLANEEADEWLILALIYIML